MFSNNNYPINQNSALNKLFQISPRRCRPPKNHQIGMLFQKGTRTQIPLQSIAYEIEIIDSLAFISLKQDYINNFNNPIETEYSFAISENACFYEFKAEIDGQIMIGQIKEKQEAKAEYEQNKAMGKTVAYSEIDKEVKDVMNVNIGNIPAHKAIRIHYGYLTELDIFLNKFWKLTIPATLGPKYTPATNADLLSFDKDYSFPQISKVEGAYPWSIKIVLNSMNEVSFLRSPSHDIVVKALDNSQTKFSVEFSKMEVPNKDFSLLFKTKDLNESRVVLAHNNELENPYCAMISLMPSFNPCSDEDAYKAFQENSAKTNYEMNLLNAKGEYIFLLDRSGSMDGKRIEMAREALRLFLKSLPMDSFFNIIGFGSHYEKTFENSIKTNDNMISQCSGNISHMKADLGGTEIYQPLKEAMKTNKINQYPKNVFILTDGDVSNVNDVLSLIGEYNEVCRVYTIGIGNGCSREIIVEGAKLGKGKHEFIAENEDMNEKIISLLEDSITPFLSDFKMNYDKNLISIVAPIPESVSFIRKNEEFKLFVFLNPNFEKEKFTALQIQYYDNYSNKIINKEIPLLITDLTIQKDYLHKYGASQVIKRIQRNLIFQKNFESDLYLAQRDNMEVYCLNFALKYQILTPFTSFICVIQQNPNVPFQSSQKIIVPSTKSSDYERQDFDREHSSPLGRALMKKSSANRGGISLKNCNLFSSMEKSKTSKQATHDLADICDSIAPNFKQSFGGLFGSSAPNFSQSKAQALNPFDMSISQPQKDQKPEWLLLSDNQKFEGFWELTEENSKIIGKKSQDLLNLMPTALCNLGNEATSIWMTCIALFFFESFNQDKKGSWRLIYQKSEQWLKSKGVNYEFLKNDIKKLFFGMCCKQSNIIHLIKTCKCGKTLEYTNNLPAYNGEFFCCDQCGALNHISGGVFHCGQCNFDLCDECNDNLQIFCNLCKNGNLKYMSVIPDPNYQVFYWCDVCLKKCEITKGVYHCVGCGKFDLCLKCKSIR